MVELSVVTEVQQKSRRLAISTDERNSLQSVVHETFYMCSKDSEGLVQSILTLCVDEIVGCVVTAKIEEERNKNIKALLVMFSVYGYCIDRKTKKYDREDFTGHVCNVWR